MPCLPKQKLVLVSHGNDAHQIPYVENNKHSLVRTIAPLILAPGEQFAYQLPDNLKTEKLAANPQGITDPRPDDQLTTYSDYSAEHRAVGGRLVIIRKKPDGSTEELLGGFFNIILDKHKKSWLPCEGEAAAIRLVLEHFRNQIRESSHTTKHFTDSQPCVLAWKRSRRGAFSSSSRIAAFLTGLSAIPVELRQAS